MFNAEDIIELEKKWFKYKVKQKIKFYIILIISTIILTYIGYQTFELKQTTQHKKENKKNIEKEVKIKKQKFKAINTKKKIINEQNNSKNTINIEQNTTVNIVNSQISNKSVLKESNNTKKTVQKKQNMVIKKENLKPYYFKLVPTDQGSELFSSNGFLKLNLPFKKEEVKERVMIKEIPIVQPIRKIEAAVEKQTIIKKPKISIDMQEVDTISYLKDKYYSTSSIVFALMLAEEYYYVKNYEDALKWSLTANDIDPQNTKSWYWFAKSKVKLNKKEDAIKALKAYLSNNNSKRLSTLLNKIELGDTDD